MINNILSLIQIQVLNSIKLNSDNINSLENKSISVFSQGGEDGITLEIIKRMDIKLGTFVEFGAGDGLENNSLILIALGWKGVWIDAKKLEITFPLTGPVRYGCHWITASNVVNILDKELQYHSILNVDLLSLDLDGNDYWILQNLLLSHFKPKIIIVEYNGLFPPPIRFVMKYNEMHVWDGGDYFGASLQSYVDLLKAHNYSLINCVKENGVNAFFVHDNYAKFFPECQKSIDELYAPARYAMRDMHRSAKSKELVAQLLSD